MKVTRKDLPKSQVQLKIEADAEQFGAFRAKALQKISDNSNIPGFRKGHIPEKVLVDHYGEGLIVSETADLAISRLLTDACEQENIIPIIHPEISLVSADPFTFSATLTVSPEVEPGNWQDVSVSKQKIEIKNNEIDDVLEKLQQRFLERKPIDRAAKKGDFLEIDFNGKTPDGVPLDGTQSKFHPVTLGEGMLLSDFEKQLEGMKKDEAKTFSIVFPKDYGAKHLAGKEVVFEVKVHSVMEQVKPEVNEEFGEKVFGKKMDETAIRAEIEKILREKAEDEERKRRENELVEKWEKLAKADLPDILIDEEVETLSALMRDRAQMADVPWELYLQNMKKTQEEYEKELRPDAEKRARQRIVLNKILSLAEVTIDEKEVTERAELMHEEMHAHGHDHGHDHSTKKGSEVWRQAAHILRVEKLFDRFLGEAPKPDTSANE